MTKPRTKDIGTITNDADLASAISEVSKYFDHVPAPGTPEAERFDTLSMLIAAYEEANHPVEEADAPRDMK